MFLLSEDFTLSLLEQLDSTQTELAVMLMSKHIHPLRSDCAQWAGKLGHVAEVLQVRDPCTCTCMYCNNYSELQFQRICVNISCVCMYVYVYMCNGLWSHLHPLYSYIQYVAVILYMYM